MKEETFALTIEIVEVFKRFFEDNKNSGYTNETLVRQCKKAHEEIGRYLDLETIFPRD